MNNTGAIILAAGQGSRMNSKEKNKVTRSLGDKPMILHITHLLEEMNINPIVIVVGFAKESVMKLFNDNVLFAEQKKRLGTAHAAHQGVKVLPEEVKHVFILNGDDSAFYKKDILEKLMKSHINNKNTITFLTLNVNDPKGLGRVVRKDGKVVSIVEEKDATNDEKNIKEINPALYLFEVSFLKKFLGKVKKSKVTGEYYLMSLLDFAIDKKYKVEGINGGNMPWRGVNTVEELANAEELLSEINASRTD